MKRRVIGLLRVSTNAQDLERQRVDVQRVISTYDLELIRSEEVDGVSGRHVKDDPQFQKVFRDLKRADVAGIAVSALDRLFRPEMFADFGILDPFKDSKKLIFSSKEGVLDPASDPGWIMALMSGAQAGMEWRELRRRSLQGKEVKRRQGRHANSPCSLPRGVAYDKQTGWRFEEPDRSRIEKAFELLFRGVSYRDMAEEIGGGWTGSGLQRALMNPVWRGVRRYEVKTKYTANRREEAFEVPIPIRLMSDERWEQAQEIIRDRHRNWAKHKRPESPFLALGLLKCGCGRPYFTRTDYRPGKHHVYYCASRWPHGRGCGSFSLWQTDVDEGIKGLVGEYLLQPELLRVLAAASLKQVGATDKGAAAKLARELAKLDGKRKRFVEMRGDGIITREELTVRLGALDRERDTLRAMLPQEKPSIEPEYLTEMIADHLADFPVQPLPKQREQLREVVKEFDVQNGAIDGFELAPGFLAALRYSGAKPLPQYLVSNHFRAADKLLIRLPEPYILKAAA